MNIHANIAARPSTLPDNDRELAVLRLLGRMGVLSGPFLHALVAFDLHINSSRRLCQRLVARKLIWQAGIPNSHVDATGRSRGRPVHVYGLTDDGRALLDNLRVEDHDGTFARLLYRSKHAPIAPTNLVTETYLSDWCASLLDQVRRVPNFAGIYIQRRYVVADAQGATVQTLGAAVMLAFDPAQQTHPTRFPWGMPWMTGKMLPPTWRILRLALEVDTGRDSQRILFDLARTYAAQTAAGGYDAGPLGGTPRPVLITRPSPRVQRIADVWSQAWPGSPTLLASDAQTAHPAYGVLWGTYTNLATSPPQPSNLLGNLFGTIDTWPQRISEWMKKAP